MTLSNNIKSIINHPALTSCEDITQIMLPYLKRHGMTVFNYYRIYSNSTLVRLSTDSEWTKHYFKMNYMNNLTVPPSYIAKPKNYYIWMEEDCPLMLKDAALNFNTSNGISIAVRHKDSIEYFCFATTLKNKTIINDFYINNLDLLNTYSLHFKDQAQSIIKLCDKNRIIFSNASLAAQTLSNDLEFFNSKQAITPAHKKLTKLQRDCGNLLSGLSHKDIAAKVNLSPSTIETHLDNMKFNKITKRQFQILNLLIQGLRVKLIASRMEISPRTVEDHINKLRVKFNAKNAIELVAKLAPYLLKIKSK